MEWHDEGIILHTHPLGESKVIVSVFTATHGRCGGVFRTSSKTKAWLHAGSKITATWRARIETQMGTWSFEPLLSYSTPLLDTPGPLMALLSAAALCHKALPEGQTYPHLYEHFEGLCSTLSSPQWMRAYVFFELTLLEELGYGLDLTCCAVTGVREGLIAVSPKTGRAVCADVAKPYEGRLFPLPSFLRGPQRNDSLTNQDVHLGLGLTGFFLEKHLLGQTLPPARIRLANQFCTG